MDNERVLASVVQVEEIIPIEGADKIELARVKGWQCIVAKEDNFKPRDYVVYLEIDSVCPKTETFAFLASKKYRVRTIKLKGVYSQGLILPLNVLPKKPFGFGYRIGEDVTTILGITKYDPQAKEESLVTKSWFTRLLLKLPLIKRLFVKKDGNRFPSFIPKTDEERIQNIPWILTKYADTEVVATVKLDGHSNTYWIKDGKFGVASRNVWLKKETNSDYWRVARKYDIENKLRKCGIKNVAIQGEQIGPTIQKNKYNLKEDMFFVFNVYDIDSKRFLNNFESYTFCLNNKLPRVCPIGHFKLGEHTLESLIEEAKGFDPIFPSCLREGIVVRSIEEQNVVGLGRFSFKVINPDFLVKHEE